MVLVGAEEAEEAPVTPGLLVAAEPAARVHMVITQQLQAAPPAPRADLPKAYPGIRVELAINLAHLLHLNK